MSTTHHPFGVFAAVVTPLNTDFTVDIDSVPRLLAFLSQRGCHGALLFGTTGEGPSFSTNERLELMRLAIQVHQEIPDFRLLVGTGAPNLDETATLTKAAFNMGFNGVVVLPPYYYKKIDEDGLFTWYQQIINKATPKDGSFFVYHIPAVTGIPLSHDLLARLKDVFPDQLAGIKDSSGDVENARLLGERFGKELVVLTGNDKLLSQALSYQASGCITALANICSPDLRQVWDAHQQGHQNLEAQSRLDSRRNIMDRYPPAPAFIKAMLSEKYGFPSWSVRPPLLPLSNQVFQQVLTQWDAIDHV
jgi:4-hydroxy-tetrahydrodipicolinate synthase